MTKGAFKLLLVEDDSQDALLIETLLRQVAPGIVVVRRASVQAGLDIIDRERPQIVLLDLAFPTLSGLDFLTALKNDARGAGLPVVVLTGVSADREVYEAYHEHANALLVKPSSPEELRHVLRAFCDFWLNAVLLSTEADGGSPSYRAEFPDPTA